MRSPRHLSCKPLQREMELDFIRGIAILLVMDFHSPGSPLRPVFLWLGFQDHIGWIGVDIFFVLSGFLVGGLLMKEWKVRKRIDGNRFLVRRGFKIWPQYYLFLLFTLFSGHRSLALLWGNLLNIQNYVGGISHTWSLAVEEHCYLLLTLCMVIAGRRRASVRAVFYFFLTICLLEIPLRYWMEAAGHPVFLPTHSRLDSIGYGVLLAMLFHFAPDRFDRLRGRPCILGLCALLCLVNLRFHNLPSFMIAEQHDAATLFAISVLLLLYRPLPAGRQHSLLYRCIAWLGPYSYGIYLWHISTVGPCQALLRLFPGGPVAHGIVIRVAEIAVGVLATRLCETPALHLRDRLFPRRVDTPVGTPALAESLDPATSRL